MSQNKELYLLAEFQEIPNVIEQSYWVLCTQEELQEELKEALSNENYEKASCIAKEIEKRPKE